MAASAAGSAPSPNITCAGSPGTRRTSTNTMSATRSNVGTASKSRLTRYFNIRRPSVQRNVPVARFARRPFLEAGDVGTLRRDAGGIEEHDGRNVLEQRRRQPVEILLPHRPVGELHRRGKEGTRPCSVPHFAWIAHLAADELQKIQRRIELGRECENHRLVGAV